MLPAELLLFALVLAPGLVVIALFIVSSYNPWPKRNLAYMIKQRFKYNPKGNAEAFDCLFKTEDVKEISGLQITKSSTYLSVVVPAMNEVERLPLMLDDCLEYLEGRVKKNADFTYEIVIVDDGSKDRTSDIAFDYSSKYPVRVLKLEANVGKGGAVRCGVLCSRGSLILFADADGATKFADFEKLEEQILEMRQQNINKEDCYVAIGSRAHLQDESVAKRTLLRTFLMFGFHMFVHIFAVSTIKDTQCGFKLFTRSAAGKLFSRIHVERWAFDIEILYLSKLLNIPISETGVNWMEIDGSKVNPITASIQMARDIILIRFRYLTGIWTVMPRVKHEPMEVDVVPPPFNADEAYMEDHIMTDTYDAEFVSPENLKNYLKKIKIKVVEETDDKMELEFDLIHVEAPIANALRRVLIAEVPTMAIEKIYLYLNSSCIPDEVLCHRIGLIPINADPRLFSFPSQKFKPIAESDEVDTEPEGYPNEHLIFNFHVKASKNANAPAGTTDPNILFENYQALSGEFKWIPIGDQEERLSNISTVHNDIVVAKLRPGQEIEARCHCVKGIGRDHSKFSPVATATYRLLPQIRLIDRVTGEAAQRLQKCFNKGVIEINKEHGESVAVVADARKDRSSRNVLRYDDLKKVTQLSKKKDHFIFSVESTGAMKSNELVVEACRIIQDKSTNLMNLFLDELRKILPEKI